MRPCLLAHIRLDKERNRVKGGTRLQLKREVGVGKERAIQVAAQNPEALFNAHHVRNQRTYHCLDPGPYFLG